MIQWMNKLLTNYFHILGLNTDATATEIRSAYRSLAKQFHPDVNSSENAKSQFIKIQEAYEVLSDPAKKANHKQLLHHNTASRTSNYSQATRERIYEDWVRHQHREELKRKVAEMRQREREADEKNLIWYSFGILKIIVYVIVAAILLGITTIPIIVFFDKEYKMSEENRMSLWIPAVMSATFLGYFIYSSFVVGRRRS